MQSVVELDTHCLFRSGSPPRPALADLDSQPRVSAVTVPSIFPTPAYGVEEGSRLPSLTPSSSTLSDACHFPLQKEEVSFIQMALGQPTCAGCGLPIQERYLAKVSDELWHESCLLCSMCGVSLVNQTSCFMRDRRVYCREDYRNVYYPKCGRCFAPVGPSDMIYRCLSAVYHLHCFSCYYCGAHLQKGDHYTVVEGQLVCSQDYDIMLNSTFGFGIDPATGESTRKAPKRPRTILTSAQRRAFKASFEMSAKPCRKVRETLAKETGLSVRVVQVWFQNQRAKMKKIQRKQEMQKLNEARKHADGKGGDLPKDDPADKPMSPEKSESIRSSDSNYSSEAEEEGTPIDKLYSMQDAYFF